MAANIGDLRMGRTPDHLAEAVKDLGEHAKARNAAAGDQMYDALTTLKDELFCANPNIDFMQRVVVRAIPKG